MSPEFNAPSDPCGLKTAVMKMVEARENALPRYKGFRLVLTEAEQEIQVDIYHRNGARLASHNVPYDIRACAPSVDRIGLVLDAFMTDFTKCGLKEDDKRALPVSALHVQMNKQAQTTSRTSRTNPKQPKSTTALVPSENVNQYDHKISLGLFGTGESHIDHLHLHYGGKLKLTYSNPWIKIFGVLGAIGRLHEDLLPTTQSQEELRILPIYALFGAGNCFGQDSQEFCMMGYLGREIFFGDFVLEDNRTARSQTLSQWLFEGGVEYGYKLSKAFKTHLGFNLGFRPGSLQFDDSQLKLSGWTWNAYTGFSFDLVKI